jgi:hypothetical protein
MGVKGILMSFFAKRNDKYGIWYFLARRADGESRVKLERERNKGTQEAIRSLPPGSTLREGGPDWSREISVPDVRASSTATSTATVISVTPIPPETAGQEHAEIDPPVALQPVALAIRGDGRVSMGHSRHRGFPGMRGSTVCPINPLISGACGVPSSCK